MKKYAGFSISYYKSDTADAIDCAKNNIGYNPTLYFRKIPIFADYYHRKSMKNRFNILAVCIMIVASFSFLDLQAQDPCSITCSAQMPICSESPVTLSVEHSPQYSYFWTPDGQITSSITVHPRETTEYQVEIHDRETDELICLSEPFTVEVKPRFNIHFRQLQLTCSNNNEENGNTAQMLAWANGSTGPYEYKWNIPPLHIAPGCDSLAIGLSAFSYYAIKVTDGRGCAQRDSIMPKAFPNPIVEIITDPGDTVYMQNPHVTYSFDNLSSDSIAIANYYWILNSQYDISSTQESPRYTYVEEGDYTTELKVFSPQGCDTSYYKTITVAPVKLLIPNVFTPNGDGRNDRFIIRLEGTDTGDSKGDYGTRAEIDDYEPINTYYESTDLVIFNRWGRIVYKSSDYNNDWDGGDLPDGTYFYVLKCHGLKQDAEYKGSVMIFRGNRKK